MSASRLALAIAPVDRSDWLLENVLLFVGVVNVRGFWGYFLPLDLTMSTSMLYELVEWVAAEAFGGGLGTAFRGSQGDMWDAQKDMALASLGALLTMAATAIVNAAYQRDFSREWVESLRVRGHQPLGGDRTAAPAGGAAPVVKP